MYNDYDYFALDYLHLTGHWYRLLITQGGHLDRVGFVLSFFFFLLFEHVDEFSHYCVVGKKAKAVPHSQLFTISC